VNNTSQATPALQPTYVTNDINSLPAIKFTAANFTRFSGAQSTPTSGLFVVYSVWKISALCIGNPGCAIFGQDQSLTNGGFEYYITGTGTTYQQIIAKAGVLQLALGTQNLAQSVYHATAMTYNFTTGAYALYNCSGGACTIDVSGTNLQSFTSYAGSIGADRFDGSFMNGNIAEVGIGTSGSVAGIGAYIQCQYGI
jgi:hypothetical protein